MLCQLQIQLLQLYITVKDHIFFMRAFQHSSNLTSCSFVETITSKLFLYAPLWRCFHIVKEET